MVDLSSAVAWVAGVPPVRHAVNAGFLAFARRRVVQLCQADPVAVQQRLLLRLLRQARDTRFGQDHGFGSIHSVADFQASVPLRTYEELWKRYLQDQYPIFNNLTWPGRIPYLALTSGTTQGATKYIPISRAMIASNMKAATTMTAFQVASQPGSRLFLGRMFFLGGSTNLEQPAPGVRQGDLSAIAAQEAKPFLRPYTFPPLELAHESDWDKKLNLLAEHSLHEPITLVGGVPSWLLLLFQRLLDLSGKATIAEVWPRLEVVVHGGVKFEPYRETFAQALGNPRIALQDAYACSEGFIGFSDPQESGLLRLVFDHGLFYEFVPLDELDVPRPTRHWLGDVQVGINYAVVVSTCAGMWAHIVGDTARFETLSPPRMVFTGRTKYTLSAFGEHLINEELEEAVAAAAVGTGAKVRDWHVGPVFNGALGHHLYVFEFIQSPADLVSFRRTLDAHLVARNADYQAHRADKVGLPLPALVVAKPGGLADWMRSQGKLGGQHKLPRMDSAGALTAQLVAFLRESGALEGELAPGEPT
jgi:hypothetical protein